MEGAKVVEVGSAPGEHLVRLKQRFGLTPREAFDVVLSGGFIEHFTDVAAIVQKHLQLLKPGGRLVVMIPNLKASISC
jgi:2-polyprenyl-3-methyl-5-hydroxy-6-metoxy-1,4-benzoquinol methylase